jgi:hypothetical protein
MNDSPMIQNALDWRWHIRIVARVWVRSRRKFGRQHDGCGHNGDENCTCDEVGWNNEAPEPT